MAKSVAAKSCILLGILLLLGAGGVLLWYFLRDDDGNSSEGNGLFGTGLFSGSSNNKTSTNNPTSTTTTNNPPSSTNVAPTLAPSFAPSAFEYPYEFNQCSSTATRCCNGLENLCDWPVSRVLFGTVHNAMATSDLFVSANHDRPMTGALQAGYRGIGVDICDCNGEFQLCHGRCGFGAKDPRLELEALVDFLNNNPNEVVLLIMELNNEAGQPVDLMDFYQSIFSQVEGLEDYLYVHENRDDPWPTLGELIASDTRIIAFHHNGPDCETEGTCPRGLHYYFSYAQETDFEFDTIDDLLDTANSCIVTRGATTTTGAFFGVNNFVASQAFETDNQRLAAEITNSYDFAKQRLQECATTLANGIYYGDDDVNMLSVDFWSIGDLVQVVQEYNQNLGTYNADEGRRQ